MKKVYARFTGDIITQKDVRLLRAECVCVCWSVYVFSSVFAFTPSCVKMRGQWSQTLTEWGTLRDRWLCMCVLSWLPTCCHRLKYWSGERK